MTGDHDTIRAVPGLSWDSAGGTILEGPALALFQGLDRAFADLGLALGASPIAFVPVLPAEDLRRVDYFSSFPHLVTLPVAVHSDPGALRTFATANASTTSGPLELARLAPVTSVLAPAACYAVYPAVSGQEIPPGGRTFTMVGACFRREDAYAPLQRQGCFRMREVVHVGSSAEVALFLERAWERARARAAEWGVVPTLMAATDPFFDPARSPKYLHQRLFPNKHEMIFQDLALGSLNDHRNFFGEAFSIRAAGSPACARPAITSAVSAASVARR